MIRAFLALPLPDDIRARLTVLQFLLPLPRRTDPDGFHITLTFLGELPETMLVAVDDAMQALRHAPFAAQIAGAGVFGGARPTAAWAGVVPSEPLARLQAKCDRAGRTAGARVESRRFMPHVTLGRFPPPPPEDALKLEQAVVAEQGFRTDRWQVDRVVLYRSYLTKSGSVYEEMADYPLT